MPNTRHPEWTAFLQAIIASPDDDTPRLAAADWLDEHDDPDRAAFIRLQVELARLEATGEGDTPAAESLRWRERAYLGPVSYFRPLWMASACPELVRVTPGPAASPLMAIHVDGADRIVFRRGFVDEVRCCGEEWLSHGSRVRGQQPVREIVMSGCNRLTRDHWYAMIPTLKNLRQLALDHADRSFRWWLADRLPGVSVSAITN